MLLSNDDDKAIKLNPFRHLFEPNKAICQLAYTVTVTLQIICSFDHHEFDSARSAQQS